MSANTHSFFVLNMPSPDNPVPKPAPDWPPVEPTPIPPTADPVPSMPSVNGVHFTFYPHMLN